MFKIICIKLMSLLGNYLVVFLIAQNCSDKKFDSFSMNDFSEVFYQI